MERILNTKKIRYNLLVIFILIFSIIITLDIKMKVGPIWVSVLESFLITSLFTIVINEAIIYWVAYKQGMKRYPTFGIVIRLIGFIFTIMLIQIKIQEWLYGIKDSEFIAIFPLLFMQDFFRSSNIYIDDKRIIFMNKEIMKEDIKSIVIERFKANICTISISTSRDTLWLATSINKKCADNLIKCAEISSMIQVVEKQRKRRGEHKQN